MSKINVVTGFLGAGKSTMVLNLLHYFEGKEKVAILVNDFGSIGIDGDIVRQGSYDVLELLQGCICCSIKKEFEKALLQLLEQYAPQRIIIEPSGIASMSQILKSIQKSQLELASIICLLDAKNFFLCSTGLGKFYFDTIKCAHHIIINKIDLVRKMETEGIARLIHSINAEANIYQSTFGKVPLAEVVTSNFELETKVEEIESPLFESFSMEISEVKSLRWSNRLIKALIEESFGNVFRAKAIIPTENKFLRVDFVLGDISTQEIKATDGKVLVIGQSLKTKAQIEEIISSF